MKKINVFLLVGIAIAFAISFTGFFMMDFIGESSIYTDFQSAKKLDRTVHVVGEWIKRDQLVGSNEMNEVEFWMSDSTQTEVKVKYYDPLPPNFETAEKVVVIGKYEGETFVADKILMKCPSKYNEGEDALTANQSL